MALKRPNTITSLADAYNNYLPPSQYINVMGVVVDMLSPTINSHSGDAQITFTLQDPEMSKISTVTKGFKARFFAEGPENLPPIKSVGDIILIRDCKVTKFQGTPLLSSTKWKTSTAVFHRDSIPEPHWKQTYVGGQTTIMCSKQGGQPDPSVAEQMYAIDLKQLLPLILPNVDAPIIDSNTTSVPSRPAAAKPSAPPQAKPKKLSLVKDLKYDQYCDLVVEVVKKFPMHDGNVELYVTDYTSNNSLYDYPAPSEKGQDEDEDYSRNGDEFNYIPNSTGSRRTWPGPYGCHTLKVELLQPHANTARESVEEGAFVALHNVRIKMSNVGKMEANLWPDKKFPAKVLVHRLTDKSGPEMQRLLTRRGEYWALLTKKQSGRKRNQEKKKAKEKRKKTALREKQANPTHDDKSGPTSKPTTTLDNKHVACIDVDVDVTTLEDLKSRDYSYIGRNRQALTLPFLNVQYKVRVRVIDFYPPTLEDFAQPKQSTETSEAARDESSYTASPSQDWIWDFFLLLEDYKPQRPDLAPAQQWVHVNHWNAQFLLVMDENATDLRRDEKTLAKLREQMAILWGDLEERKTAATKKGVPYPPNPTGQIGDEQLSNMPFHCCIHEHGQLLDTGDVESGDPSGYYRYYEMSSARIVG